MTFSISRRSFLLVASLAIFHLITSPSDTSAQSANRDTPVPVPVVQIGHTGQITALAISPNNRIIVSGGDDGTLRYWDRVEGILLNVIRAHTESVRTVSISPDGRIVASGGGDRAVRLW